MPADSACCISSTHGTSHPRLHDCVQRFTEASDFAPAIHGGWRWHHPNARFTPAPPCLSKAAETCWCAWFGTSQALGLEAGYNLQKVINFSVRFSSKQKTLKSVAKPERGDPCVGTYSRGADALFRVWVLPASPSHSTPSRGAQSSPGWGCPPLPMCGKVLKPWGTELAQRGTSPTPS